MSLVSISKLFPAELAERAHNLHAQLQLILQKDITFNLSYAKTTRMNRLCGALLKKFRSGEPIDVFVTKTRFHNLRLKRDGFRQRSFSLSEFASNEGGIRSELFGSIVLITNGDTANGDDCMKYISIYENSPDTLFIGWDTDNHWALFNSIVLASHTDLYAPTHLENSYELSRFNKFIRHAPSATIAWSREMLAKNMQMIANTERSREPIGRHHNYNFFPYRNKVVSTLNNHFPQISWQNTALLMEDELTNLVTMCKHKLHWVIPTLNDVSTRILDIMITGGIPVVPESLKIHPMINKIHGNDIIFYRDTDLLSPFQIVEFGNNLFDRHGLEGVMRRFSFGWNNHIDSRIDGILDHAIDAFGREDV